MIGIYILLVLMSTRLSEGSFYISSEKSSWHEQSRNCTPAKLNVIGADTGYKLGENTVLDIPHFENVWVGYYQVTRVFEYIGCASISELFNNEERSYIAIKGDPGHCYPECGITTIIGVTKTRCYCLGSEFNASKQTEAGCSDICKNPLVACGHDDEKNTYLSIYKMNTEVTASTKSQATVENNCLSMTPNVPKTFIWAKCNHALRVMCTYGESVKEFGPKSEGVQRSWFHAANTCFQNKVLPTIYSNCKDVISSSSPLWTGMFKTNVVYKHDAKIQEKRRYDPMSFGYLRRDTDGSVKLLFTETDSEAKSNKRAICDDGNDDGFTFTFPSTKTSSTGQSSERYATKTLGGTDVTIAICTSFGLLVLVIVFLVCFFRYRKNSKRLSSGEATNETAGIERNAPTPPTQNNCHGSNNYHNYFVLEPIGKQTDNKAVTYDTTTEDMAFKPKNEISDYMKIDQNIYNKLDDETTYDHTVNDQRNCSKSFEKDMDETYDKSIVVKKINFKGKQMDNIYNQSEETDKDEYSHFGPLVTKIRTDNVYGVHENPGELDSDYDINISKHCVNNKNTDNTYSCLSEESYTEKKLKSM